MDEPIELAEYDFVKFLARGSYGSVSLIKHKQTGELVALKKMNYDATYEREIAVANKLTGKIHPNVVKTIFSFHDVSKTNGYIGIEYVEGGDLRRGICSKLSRKENIQVAINLCKGLRFLHENHIVHGDIKLENTLCTSQDSIKLIDFGFSRILNKDEECVSGRFGTLKYISWETVVDAVVCFSSDIWSLGVLIYRIDQATSPFDGRDQQEIFLQIRSLDFKRPKGNPFLNYSQIFCHPRQRMTLEQIQTELEDKLLL